MAGEWTSLPFSEAVVINPPISLKRGGRYPFVDMAAITPGSRCVHASGIREFSGGGSRFEDGDTLMARITPCLENGKIARYCAADSGPAHGSTEFIVIRGRRTVTDSGFAYYLTQSDTVREYAIGQMTGTSGRQRVPSDALAHLVVQVPPLSEQRAIAHILGTLDDKIELNRRMSETLEAIARALFKSWFVDFDPVRAKMEGRDPGLPKDIADLFPDRLVKSELGEIPEGWTARTLSDVIDLNPSCRLKCGDRAPYLDMAGAPTRGHAPEEIRPRAFGSGVRFVNGDTLLARITPCLENGKTAFVDFLEDGEVGWGSTEFIVMRPRPPLPPEYAYCLARSEAFRDHAIRSMTGSSGRQRVQLEALAHYPLVVPRDEIAAAFGLLASLAIARGSAAVNGLRTLASMRDALLPKLITGQLRTGMALDAEEVRPR